MELQNVIKNLEYTIYGKQDLLFKSKARLDKMWYPSGERMALQSSISFLEINIAELERITADLKQCSHDLHS